MISLASDLLIEQLDDELVVWEPRLRQLHRLDATASLVLAVISEGPISLDGLLSEIQEAVRGVSSARLRSDVESLVAQLTDLGLILSA